MWLKLHLHRANAKLYARNEREGECESDVLTAKNISISPSFQLSVNAPLELKILLSTRKIMHLHV